MLLKSLGMVINSLFLSGFLSHYQLKMQSWKCAVAWINLVIWWDPTVAALSLTKTVPPPTLEKSSAIWISQHLIGPCSVCQVKMKQMEWVLVVMTFRTLEDWRTVVFKVDTMIYLTSMIFFFFFFSILYCFDFSLIEIEMLWCLAKI